MSTETTAIKPVHRSNEDPPKKNHPPNLDEIKQQIALCQKDIENSYQKIGRLLLEVKKIKPHGQWMPWINENTELTICKAERLMKVVRWMDGNEAPVPHLTFTKAYILSRLSSKDLDEFGEFIGGIENITGMTKRELEAKVRDFLISKEGKSSTKQAKTHVSDGDNLLKAFEQIKNGLSEVEQFVDDGDSDKYGVFVTEICEICQTVIQKISPEDAESI